MWHSPLYGSAGDSNHVQPELVYNVMGGWWGTEDRDCTFVRTCACLFIGIRELNPYLF